MRPKRSKQKFNNHSNGDYIEQEHKHKTTTFSFSSYATTDIAECEFQIGKMQASNKANTELKNSFKIKQYSEVIGALANPAYLNLIQSFL